MKNVYTPSFYKVLQVDARGSAQEIVPLILDLIHPQSVVDAGCGVGSWLSVFRDLGVEDVLGVDGAWVDQRMLEIPPDKFLTYDLTKPLRLDRSFDLVMSLEVAQHIPEEAVETFVDSLTRLGPVILFSSAIPLQGPPALNQNGQWPEYWVQHFEKHSYEVIDYVRSKIWNNEAVGGWYAQNMLLFVRRDYVEGDEGLASARERTDTARLSLVHPRIWLWHKGVLENNGLLRWSSRLAWELHLLPRRLPWHPVQQVRRLFGGPATR